MKVFMSSPIKPQKFFCTILSQLFLFALSIYILSCGNGKESKTPKKIITSHNWCFAEHVGDGSTVITKMNFRSHGESTHKDGLTFNWIRLSPQEAPQLYAGKRSYEWAQEQADKDILSHFSVQLIQDQSKIKDHDHYKQQSLFFDRILKENHDLGVSKFNPKIAINIRSHKFSFFREVTDRTGYPCSNFLSSSLQKPVRPVIELKLLMAQPKWLISLEAQKEANEELSALLPEKNIGHYKVKIAEEMWPGFPIETNALPIEQLKNTSWCSWITLFGETGSHNGDFISMNILTFGEDKLSKQSYALSSFDTNELDEYFRNEVKGSSIYNLDLLEKGTIRATNSKKSSLFFFPIHDKYGKEILVQGDTWYKDGVPNEEKAYYPEDFNIYFDDLYMQCPNQEYWELLSDPFKSRILWLIEAQQARLSPHKEGS